MKFDNTLLYHKIKNHLRKEIIGKAESNKEIRLDAERKMAEDLGVSRFSINKAISELVVEGYLVKKRGIGVFIPSREQLTAIENQFNTLALILPDMNDYYYAQISREIEKIAFENNIGVMLSLTGKDAAKEKAFLEGILKQRVVKGIIAVPNVNQPNDSMYRKLHRSGIPVVLINRIHENMTDMPYIIYEQGQGSFLGVLHLVQNGKRNLLFIGDETGGYHAKLRKSGFDRAVAELGGVRSYELYNNEDNFEEKVIQFIERYRIDGIVAFNDIVATKVMNRLVNQGIKIPEEIGIVGHDNSYLSEIAICPLTSVKYPKKQLAAMSYEMLLKLIKGESCEIHQTVPVSLIIRESSEMRNN